MEPKRHFEISWPLISINLAAWFSHFYQIFKPKVTNRQMMCWWLKFSLQKCVFQKLSNFTDSTFKNYLVLFQPCKIVFHINTYDFIHIILKKNTWYFLITRKNVDFANALSATSWLPTRSFGRHCPDHTFHTMHTLNSLYEQWICH